MCPKNPPVPTTAPKKSTSSHYRAQKIHQFPLVYQKIHQIPLFCRNTQQFPLFCRNTQQFPLFCPTDLLSMRCISGLWLSACSWVKGQPREGRAMEESWKSCGNGESLDERVNVKVKETVKAVAKLVDLNDQVPGKGGHRRGGLWLRACRGSNEVHCIWYEDFSTF